MGIFDVCKKKKKEEQEEAQKENQEQASKEAEEQAPKEAEDQQLTEADQEEEEATAEEKPSNKTIEDGLEKTKSSFFSKLGKAVAGKSKVDDEILDELEEVLVGADVGVDTTVKIIERIEKRVAKDKYFGAKELNKLLRDEILELVREKQDLDFEDFSLPKQQDPYVIMVVGVNGVGKTTTIGKLAHQYKQNGKKVTIGASDTFRAGAVDQLKIWSERVDVPIISRGMNADPASVAYDTVESAKSQGADVAILDTAGRLHNKENLMRELGKIRDVVKKITPDAPQEILLVLDASTGQNAIEQAREFVNTTDVNTLALTKLDGTAKGGVVIGIIDQFQMPVKYIGIGEKLDDLRVFNRKQFIDSLFENAEKFAV
jgi:fused signal recognition particle receptor